jgi:hypothetical protein
MPRGRRKAVQDVGSLEQELNSLKQRQAELRAQLRRLKSGASGVRKLEEKLAKQLSTAKWTVGQIKEISPGWDEVGFYQSVKAKQPTPRGRRPRSAATA